MKLGELAEKVAAARVLFGDDVEVWVSIPQQGDNRQWSDKDYLLEEVIPEAPKYYPESRVVRLRGYMMR